MTIAVSFVNMRVPGVGVQALDGDGRLCPLPVGPAQSFTGMARSGDLLHVVVRGDLLATVDLATRTLLDLVGLPASLTHSLAVDGPDLLVVSTGTGEVKLRDGEGRWATLWSHTTIPGDRYHLNSVAVHDHRVVVSAFGPRSGRAWATAVNGYVLDTGTGDTLAEGVAQPHSLLSWQGDLWWCESARGNVQTLSGRSWHVGGYTRGLAPLGDGLVVGTSSSRNAGGGTGCALWHLDPATGSVDRLVDCSHVGPEIYSVVTADGGS